MTTFNRGQQHSPYREKRTATLPLAGTRKGPPVSRGEC